MITYTYLSAEVLSRNMNVLSMHWPSEFRQLLFIGIVVLTAVVLSYEYVTAEGTSDAFFGIIGAGLLLTMLVIVPVLLVTRRNGSD